MSDGVTDSCRFADGKYPSFILSESGQMRQETYASPAELDAWLKLHGFMAVTGEDYTSPDGRRVRVIDRPENLGGGYWVQHVEAEHD